jgi:hypothetical protein
MLIYHYHINNYRDRQREEDILLAQQLNQGYIILSATPIFEMSNGDYKTTEIIYVLQKED